MTRAIVIVTVSVLIGPAMSAAHGQGSTPQTLADVAKTEEARRKNVKKPAKVYTNESLKPDTGTVRPAAPATPATPAPPSTQTPVVNLPGGTVPAPTGETRDQAYWSEKISSARATLDRSRIFADALQSRINALKTDFVNRDDPAQRAKIDLDLKAALAELDRVRKEIETQQKAITAIEDEARRAGVPSGWLRPAA